jgi:hypothetical protein
MTSGFCWKQRAAMSSGPFPSGGWRNEVRLPVHLEANQKPRLLPGGPQKPVGRGACVVAAPARQVGVPEISREKQKSVHDLIERSFLSDEAKARYRSIFIDRLVALRQ